MKKLLTISLIIISLLLSSCSIDWNNEKDKKIAELEGKTEELETQIYDDLFEKKQECIKYKDDIHNFTKRYSSQIFNIDEIFYSNKGKSCYFVAIRNHLYEDGRSRNFKMLFNYLNQKLVLEVPLNMEGGYLMDNEFEEILKELKGE